MASEFYNQLMGFNTLFHQMMESVNKESTKKGDLFAVPESFINKIIGEGNNALKIMSQSPASFKQYIDELTLWLIAPAKIVELLEPVEGKYELNENCFS
nr:hypothetical protein [Dehalococcoidales bacterium]